MNVLYIYMVFLAVLSIFTSMILFELISIRFEIKKTNNLLKNLKDANVKIEPKEQK